MKLSELNARSQQAREKLRSCTLCPNRCGKDRLAGELGLCRTGRLARVSSYGPHFGEERPLVGRRGSGTIFFSQCNLRCVYCQNYTISQMGEGREVTADELAGMMLSLQESGCHNVNLVSPTHVIAQVLEAMEVACRRGLYIPVVYNTGGYDSVEALRLLDGIVDIYMPDMKYSDAEIARRYSGIKGYPEANRAAVKEMHRQVGDLKIDSTGVATRGLLVRHLVLPEGLSGTAEVARFLYEEISPNTYLNVMPQYRPAFHAASMPPLDRPVTREEYVEAVQTCLDQGLRRLDSMYRGRGIEDARRRF